MVRLRFVWWILVPFVGLWADFIAMSAPVPKPKEFTTPFIKWAAKDEFVSNGPSNPLFIKDRVIVGTDKGELTDVRMGRRSGPTNMGSGFSIVRVATANESTSPPPADSQL